MAEHLPVHKAELDKLATFICSIQDSEIKQVATEQYMIMQDHVKVMIALMNPDQNEYIGINDLYKWESVQINNSGLRMKAEIVRNNHIHMALQQTKLLNRYTALMDKFMKDRDPESSREEQSKTPQTFKKMFHM
ncbi:hypothetical protein [Halobacillus litoralis]|uniref:hypothetical protein n=1 Tax=Halobacillus litoralis TaxID=45668 RepID=UPI001CD66EA9|nr:hypothetical protein [Halobacillus litoralis]MCA1023675.1 hypothetical protein [Halobacillus litoralis]